MGLSLVRDFILKQTGALWEVLKEDRLYGLLFQRTILTVVQGTGSRNMGLAGARLDQPRDGSTLDHGRSSEKHLDSGYFSVKESVFADELH